MTLHEFLLVYLEGRSVGAASQTAIRASINRFGEHLGRPATLADLTDETLARWVTAAEESGRWRPPTIKRMRDDVMGLWRDAHRRQLVADPPRGKRRIAWECHYRPFTPDEQARVLEAAEALGNYYLANGVKCSTLVVATFRIALETGYSRTEIVALDWPAVQQLARENRISGETRALVLRIRRILRLNGEDHNAPLAWPGSRNSWDSVVMNIKRRSRVARSIMESLADVRRAAA